MGEQLFWVRYETPGDEHDAAGYCLTHGPGTARWTGTRAQAEEKASMLQATSYFRDARYTAVPVQSGEPT